MENTFDAASLKPILPAEDSELDLYTIPSSSSWFSWDTVHETEKTALKEFFYGGSYSRTPKIYKEYRDFIINKYREEPSRRLTFTEVRKSLVGDVTLLHKVFNLLEKWGLINFRANLGDESGPAVCGGEEEKGKVRVEEGAPNGVRVVATPNSLKPISVPLSAEVCGEAFEDGPKLPLSLSSYGDVFVNSMTDTRLICGNCGENCDSGHHESTKEDSFIICVKCFKNVNYGEKNTIDDFKYIETSSKKDPLWTEEETLLLLDSVMKHGDDWELVIQNIPTKSKLDCISKLIQLPFGELMLHSINTRDSTSSAKQVPLTSAETQEIVEVNEKDQSLEQKKNIEQNGDSENESPPLKKQCVVGNSLMKQIAVISTMVSPRITAAAADAAISGLCDENQLEKEIFITEDDNSTVELQTLAPNPEPESVHVMEDSEMKETPSLPEPQELSKKTVPLTLRMKVATATALGAAAAHAKLLADQEEREMEHIVASVITIQMKKLNYKIKLMEDLGQIMEKEHNLIEEMEHSIIAERINILQNVFNSGLSRRRHHSSVKS